MNLYPPIYQTSLGTPRDLGSLLSMKSQGFGENVSYYQQHFGTNGHPGIDFGCPTGTLIYAAHDGTVESVSLDSTRGEGVILRGPDGVTLYWHMEQPLVIPGQVVKAGDKIGLSDNTGLSTGPHLHFEYRPDSESRTNGFYGAVDPTPFLVWQPIPLITMTTEEVSKQYALAFYRLPTADELAFWTGKPLIEFLNTAIKDRASFLQTNE